uniref:Transcription factor GTE4-like isoform X1 n=1 Tax=Tanacetum cinerariifolium TaxID=118510 RepID=A0A6L2NSJ8_TANCI|nr:transcription factor GTE4-like isoform X1 [Tanacetum cinerariifolium]
MNLEMEVWIFKSNLKDLQNHGSIRHHYKFDFPTSDDRPVPPIISFNDASFGYPGEKVQEFEFWDRFRQPCSKCDDSLALSLLMAASLVLSLLILEPLFFKPLNMVFPSKSTQSEISHRTLSVQTFGAVNFLFEALTSEKYYHATLYQQRGNNIYIEESIVAATKPKFIRYKDELKKLEERVKGDHEKVRRLGKEIDDKEAELTAFSTVVSSGVGGDAVEDYSRSQYFGNGRVEGGSLVGMGAETSNDFMDRRAIFDGIFQSYAVVIAAFVFVAETE